MTRPTPTPWPTPGEGDTNEHGDVYIESPSGSHIAICTPGEPLHDLPSRANAEFIVRAVNAHDRLVEALEDMVWQFGYRRVDAEGPAVSTGGLSALEYAFEALGWDDPHRVDASVLCDVADCSNWSDSGLRWEGMYLSLCGGHATSCLSNDPRPALREKAYEREAKRGPDGILRDDATPARARGEAE